MEMLRIDSVISCEVIRRANRFVVDVLIDGRPFRAYINNTGRLLEFMVKGRKAYCIERRRPGKTKYRLFAIHDMNAGALIDTWFQSVAFERAVSMELIPWLDRCRLVKRNVKLYSSVIDYLLMCDGEPFYLETKSAVFRGNSYFAMYPDCPTERGRRHLKTLIKHVLSGGRGGILFIAALPNVRAFKPYVEGDPEVFKLLLKGIEVGVEVRAISMYYDPKSSTVKLTDANMDVHLYASNHFK